MLAFLLSLTATGAQLGVYAAPTCSHAQNGETFIVTDADKLAEEELPKYVTASKASCRGISPVWPSPALPQACCFSRRVGASMMWYRLGGAPSAALEHAATSSASPSGFRVAQPGQRLRAPLTHNLVCLVYEHRFQPNNHRRPCPRTLTTRTRNGWWHSSPLILILLSMPPLPNDASFVIFVPLFCQVL